MIVEIFAVKDKCAQGYLQPMFFQNVGMAVRAFRDAAVDDTHMFSRNRRDFSLYRLGSFDDVTGILSPLVEPEFVISADMMLEAKEA